MRQALPVPSGFSKTAKVACVLVNNSLEQVMHEANAPVVHDVGRSLRMHVEALDSPKRIAHEMDRMGLVVRSRLGDNFCVQNELD